MVAKAPGAFRTISEAATEVGVALHVLRFWETRFPFLRPVRRGGGQRLYRPGDIQTLRALRKLLRDEGRSIPEVQSLARQGRLSDVIATGKAPEPSHGADARTAPLAAALEAAIAAKARLDRLLAI